MSNGTDNFLFATERFEGTGKAKRAMNNRFIRRIIFCGFVLWVCSATLSVSCAELKHVVQKGETVSAIARTYNVKPEEIIELNKLENPDEIFPGQELTIRRSDSPASEVTQVPSSSGVKHTVRKGETIWGISRKYGVEPEEIIRANRLRDPSLISPGQVLIIPGGYPPKAPQQDMAALCRLGRRVRPRRWRYIVIHHSATTTGNAAIFDQYHKRRGMENGLAYHFVIGNGKGSGDGEIEVGGRWVRQLQGGHTRNYNMNSIGIGICLVGDFNKGYASSDQQDSLVRLVKYLMAKYNIPKRRVIGHREVPESPTDCPGKNFSLVKVRNRL